MRDIVNITHRAGWSLRQVLLVVLGVNVILLGLDYLGLTKADTITSFFWLGLINVVVYCGGIYLFIRYKAGGTWADLGLRGKRLHLILGAISGLLLAAIVLLLGVLVIRLVGKQPEPQTVQDVASQAGSLWQAGLFILTGSILVPVKEEVLFRGFLYPALRNKLGITLGIVVTSVIFALVHGDLIRALPLLIGGIALNVLYQRTGSLFPGIIAHGVWNLVMSLLTFWR